MVECFEEIKELDEEHIAASGVFSEENHNHMTYSIPLNTTQKSIQSIDLDGNYSKNDNNTNKSIMKSSVKKSERATDSSLIKKSPFRKLKLTPHKRNLEKIFCENNYKMLSIKSKSQEQTPRDYIRSGELKPFKLKRLISREKKLNTQLETSLPISDLLRVKVKNDSLTSIKNQKSADNIKSTPNERVSFQDFFSNNQVSVHSFKKLKTETRTRISSYRTLKKNSFVSH